VWTVFALVTLALPALLSTFADLIPDRPGISKRAHVRAVGRSFATACAQIGLGVTFLAYQAWLMSDAIGRTLGRLYLTHRRLLEWTTAAQAKSDMSREIAGVYRRMRGAPIVAVAGGALVALARPDSAIRRAGPRAMGPLASWSGSGWPPACRDTTPSPSDMRTSAPRRAARRFFDS
jgi:cyclic beta-1,2-glucan synthetase